MYSSIIEKITKEKLIKFNIKENLYKYCSLRFIRWAWSSTLNDNCWNRSASSLYWASNFSIFSAKSLIKKNSFNGGKKITCPNVGQNISSGTITINVNLNIWIPIFKKYLKIKNSENFKSNILNFKVKIPLDTTFGNWRK